MPDKLNARIRAYCIEHGLKFKPWEEHPADVSDGPSPWPRGSGGAASWPKAQALRRKIIAALKQGSR